MRRHRVEAIRRTALEPARKMRTTFWPSRTAFPDTSHGVSGALPNKTRRGGMRLRDVYNLLAEVVPTCPG